MTFTLLCGTSGVTASDHLDTPSVVADPSADIGDLYAWMSPTAPRLNLAMTIVGHTFSDRLRYVFHVESGRRFGRTQTRMDITCRVPAPDNVDCRLGNLDVARGDASGGVEGRNRRFVVFAGLRDDPFFNNVRGTRAVYRVARDSFERGVAADSARCPAFGASTSQAIRDQWRRTDGGPAGNFLAGWTVSAIVVSVDLAAVNRGGGDLLAVWASTESRGRQIDRAGRPLTGNALLGTVAAEEIGNRLKEEYNAARPRAWSQFIPEIETGLALYDGFDGVCGNQLLAGSAATPERYRALAALLADDRLWVNSAATQCTQFFAVELAALARQSALADDCGGRTPTYDAIDVYRSELAMGALTGIDDGVDGDDRAHSNSAFPFLAAPAATARTQ